MGDAIDAVASTVFGASYARDVSLYRDWGARLGRAAPDSRGSNLRASKSFPPFSGLLNQGGTCYLNSLLQGLYYNDVFRRSLFSWRYRGEAVHGTIAECLPAQLQLLFGRMATSVRAASSTEGLTASFGWTTEDAFVQHDAQELARILFDALERSDVAVLPSLTSSDAALGPATSSSAFGMGDAALVAAGVSSVGGTEIGTGADSGSGSGSGSSTTTTSSSSLPSSYDLHAAPPGALAHLLRTAFVGEMRDVLQCQVCGSERSQVERFADLELAVRPIGSGGAASPATVVDSNNNNNNNNNSSSGSNSSGSLDNVNPSPPTTSLLSLLSTYLSPESLSGNEAVQCDVCQKRSPCTKRLGLSRLPSACLTFHLKRFGYDAAAGRYVKIMDPVEIPFHMAPVDLIVSASPSPPSSSSTLSLAPLPPSGASLASQGSSDEKEASASAAVEGVFAATDSTSAASSTSDSSSSSSSSSSPSSPYTLSAVLMHAGGVSSGHYFAFVKASTSISNPEAASTPASAATTTGKESATVVDASELSSIASSGLYDGWLLANDAGVWPVTEEEMKMVLCHPSNSSSDVVAATLAAHPPPPPSSSSSLSTDPATTAMSSSSFAMATETVLITATSDGVSVGGDAAGPSSISNQTSVDPSKTAAAVVSPSPRGAPIPKGGTPYLLLYTRPEPAQESRSAGGRGGGGTARLTEGSKSVAVLEQEQKQPLQQSSPEFLRLSAYASSMGCSLLPPHILAQLEQENADFLTMREAAEAKDRLVEVTVLVPASLPLEIVAVAGSLSNAVGGALSSPPPSSDATAAGAGWLITKQGEHYRPQIIKPLSFLAPSTATFAELKNLAYALWLARDGGAGADSNEHDVKHISRHGTGSTSAITTTTNSASADSASSSCQSSTPSSCPSSTPSMASSVILGTILSPENVRLCRFEASTGLHQDTYSTESALQSTLSSAGYVSRASLVLEARILAVLEVAVMGDGKSVDGATVATPTQPLSLPSSPVWPEYDPAAITVLVYKWSPLLYKALQDVAADGDAARGPSPPPTIDAAGGANEFGYDAVVSSPPTASERTLFPTPLFITIPGARVATATLAAFWSLVEKAGASASSSFHLHESNEPLSTRIASSFSFSSSSSLSCMNYLATLIPSGLPQMTHGDGADAASSRGGSSSSSTTRRTTSSSSSSSSSSSATQALQSLPPSTLLHGIDLCMYSGDVIVLEEVPVTDISSSVSGGEREEVVPSSSTSGPPPPSSYAYLKSLISRDTLQVQANLLIPEGCALPTLIPSISETSSSSSSSSSLSASSSSAPPLPALSLPTGDLRGGELSMDSNRSSASLTAVFPHHQTSAATSGATPGASFSLSASASSFGSPSSFSTSSTSLASSSFDTTGMDAETRAAIEAALAEDSVTMEASSNSMTSRGGVGGGSSRQYSSKYDPTESSEEGGKDGVSQYIVSISARRSDSLLVVKQRLLEACAIEYKRLMSILPHTEASEQANGGEGSSLDTSTASSSAATAMAASTDSSASLATSLLNPSRVRLSRGVDSPHYRSEATVRLSDLDIGDGAMLHLSHGAPLEAEALVLHPTVVWLPPSFTAGGRNGAVASTASEVDGSGKGLHMLQPSAAAAAAAAGASLRSSSTVSTSLPASLVNTAPLTLPRLLVTCGVKVSALKTQVLTHLRLALEKRTPQQLEAILGPSSKASDVTAKNLRLRFKNSPQKEMAQTSGRRAPHLSNAPQSLASSAATPSLPALSNYGLALRDDATLRPGLAPVIKIVAAGQASALHTSACGIGIDTLELMIHLSPAFSPPLLSHSHMILRLREFRPAPATSVTPGGSSARSGTLGSTTSSTSSMAARKGGAAVAPSLGPTEEFVLAKTATYYDLLAALQEKASQVAAEDKQARIPSLSFRFAKPATFGPPLTATTAAALKWAVLPSSLEINLGSSNSAATSNSKVGVDGTTKDFGNSTTTLLSSSTAKDAADSASSAGDKVATDDAPAIAVLSAVSKPTPVSSPPLSSSSVNGAASLSSPPLSARDGLLILWRMDDASTDGGGGDDGSGKAQPSSTSSRASGRFGGRPFSSSLTTAAGANSSSSSSSRTNTSAAAPTAASKEKGIKIRVAGEANAAAAVATATLPSSSQGGT